MEEPWLLELEVVAGNGRFEGGFLGREWGASSKADTCNVSTRVWERDQGKCTGGVEFEVFVEVGVAEVALRMGVSVRSSR